MKKIIKNNFGSITLCEIPEPDHLGRVHLEVRIGERYVYLRGEEVKETIEALKVKLEEIRLKSPVKEEKTQNQ